MQIARFHCLVILNRGDAALRCIRAVKALRAAEGSDLRVAALYSESDREAPYVRHADRAVAIESPAGELAAWLDYDVLENAIRAVGGDAVWPGWGFVSEDPVFVERLEAAGIAFLGPSSQAMRAVGDKIGAKQLAEEHGIPVLPWSGAALADEAEAERRARELGGRLLLKAAAGGGGRGIRSVDTPDEAPAAFRSARAQAEAAFGDGRLFLEARVDGGRHIEVQIAADAGGRVLALGCRDCSVQRHHQKLVEEAPPAALAPELRAALEEAALRFATGVGYRGLGTVEFLVGDAGFHFLEMNPRLQVEHAVTEVVTGLDLVQLQIRIARGESLEGLEVRESGCAIEARICAEDAEAGFAPAPGRVVRFDPALGPQIRLDTGVAAGSRVPPVFDSLVAKLIASGENREEARARLLAALEDLDLVVAGGATNRGYLMRVLAHPDFRAGPVHTGWLDAALPPRGSDPRLAALALTAAAILQYQRSRAVLRLGFYADPTRITPDRIPASEGQEIDLVHAGRSYRLRVFAIGSWRYRVQLDARTLDASLREEGAHTARLEIGVRALRVLHDVGDAGLRIEVEGRAFRFTSGAAGQVRAAAPAVVVSVAVAAGDRVVAGQPLGLLEAMKMELAFEAPVAGVVDEIRVRPGQQVAAGDLLLSLAPAEPEAAEATGEHVELPSRADPLEPLFAQAPGDVEARVDLARADATPAAERRAAIAELREEIRRVLLGYDADPSRTELLAAFLEAPLPELSDAFCWELAEIRHELRVFADVARLFARTPSASASGDRGPSNAARLRMYVRRIRAAGAGIAEPFLDLVRAALQHYDVAGLEPCDALERAVLRLLSSQSAAEVRDRLVLALLERLAALAHRGVHLGDDPGLRDTLELVAALRGLVSDRVADAATDACYVLFERPRIEAEFERTGKHVQVWLDSAGSRPNAPPESVLQQLADAPRPVFERIGSGLASPDSHSRAIALAAHVRRLYSPAKPVRAVSLRDEGGWVDRIELADGRRVLAAACELAAVPAAVARLAQLACEQRDQHEGPAVSAIELLVPAADAAPGMEPGAICAALGDGLPCARLTLTAVRPGGPDAHRSFVPSPDGYGEDETLHGIHPEAAARIDLARLARFDLTRLEAEEGLFVFRGTSREEPGDQRVFVAADVRGRSPEDGHEADLHLPAFEHAFHEATRALRGALSRHDPGRRLQWNRITLYVAPEIFLDPSVAEGLARRLAPATLHLGLEKVVVRLRLLDRAAPEHPARETELVISDAIGGPLRIERRSPLRSPLAPRSDLERKIAETRRRGLVYPYEIVRMLLETTHGGALGRGRFSEYELSPDDPTRLVPVERPWGENPSAVVVGVVETPTDKVPEGMRRVVLLSDPTRGMGALAAPECDRIVAALDLASELELPVEWLPVSSGARIAMDSGTENLDATARVVRSLVRFTSAGGSVHVIVDGVNVGAQSYFDALATMGMHTRGALIMTPGGSMVLTGRAALEASGSVSGEDEQAIGGFEGVMGPNGEAQYYASDLADAVRILHEHYRYCYRVPGEGAPRRLPEPGDSDERNVCDTPIRDEGDFAAIGEIFDAQHNPGRKRPFPMRALMRAVADHDGGMLERWAAWSGAETAVVCDTHLGGRPVCMIGIESRPLTRLGYRPSDGPADWTGGTLFPLSSRKLARALRAASGNRPAVILANLSGFDGSPESLRRLQLEFGAEIARAVVDFVGPILFLVVSRYHGGAYVVFSRQLNPRLRAAAVEGSYASVIGGSAAASVVLTREVGARTARDPRVAAGAAGGPPSDETVAAVRLEKQAELAREFDAVHSVARARDVGSLEAIVPPARIRPYLIGLLAEEEARDRDA